MTKITTVANQKGGVGKTTTALALATGLVKLGNRTLLIDLDPQANATLTTKSDDSSNGVYELLKGYVSAKTIIQKHNDCDVISSNSLLAGADKEFISVGREYLLREALEPILADYDNIIIDTPPTLSILSINALACSDDVVIPLGADIYSLQGLGQLLETINQVQRYCNPKLKINGLLITKFKGNTILGKDMKTVIQGKAESIKARLYDTIIRNGVVIKEAQAQQQNIYDYAPHNSKPVEDYRNFIKEFVGGVQ